MKFEARKRPDLKIEKKNFKKFHAYAKCEILISQTVSFKFPQNLPGDVEFDTDQHTKRRKWANAHSGRYTDKKLIKGPRRQKIEIGSQGLAPGITKKFYAWSEI